MLAVAKITAKGQTTIPQNIRAALNVALGDLIAGDSGADGIAPIRRVQPLDVEYLLAVARYVERMGGCGRRGIVP